MLQILQPILHEMKENLTSVNETIIQQSGLISDRATTIDESLIDLRGDLEQYKNQTTSELDYLQSSFNTTLRRKVVELKDMITSPPVHTCGGTAGWRRVVYMDMKDSNTDCPSGWRETGYSKRTCGRTSTEHGTCDSVTFPVSGGEYNQVCGRIKAYQWGTASVFYDYFLEHNTIDDSYFGGVAVMHGSPRQHIWTFAAGTCENYTAAANFICPCDIPYSQHTPPFVGEDYFCESGYICLGYWDTNSLYSFHFNDTLWDGRDCHSSSTCCSHHNPPYFTKTLSMSTTDDIELRMCLRLDLRHQDIAVELIELYVKN